AVAALQALSDDDPRALAIVCQAANSQWRVGKAEELWTRAAAIDARRPPVSDQRTRYASLLRDTLRLSSQYHDSSSDSLLTSRFERVHQPRIYHVLDPCEHIDHAAVRLQFAAHVGPSHKVLEELYAEIERDLGLEDPAL